MLYFLPFKTLNCFTLHRISTCFEKSGWVAAGWSTVLVVETLMLFAASPAIPFAGRGPGRVPLPSRFACAGWRFHALFHFPAPSSAWPVPLLAPLSFPGTAVAGPAQASGQVGLASWGVVVLAWS